MIELRVLGSLRLTASDGRDLEGLARQPKRVALLAYLAAAMPRGFHRRDKLFALFWPEVDDARARAALNQALYVLRSALGERAIVTRGDGEVGVDGDVVWCDARAFVAALDGGRPAEALDLYAGGLLDGFFVPDSPAFEEWLETERTRLRQRASEGAWALAEALTSRGDQVEAARWARRAADLLPADEAVVRRLMTFLHQLGDRAAAVRAYEAFAWQLQKEYELEPSAETQALALALREGGRHPASVTFMKAASLPFPNILVAVRRPAAAGWAAAVLVVVIALVATAVWLRPSSESSARPVVTFTMAFPGFTLVRGGVTGSTITLSPDGSRMAFLADREGSRQLHLRELNRLESTPVPHTQGATLPFFSPDGDWLGFVAAGEIRRVSTDGGPAIGVYAVGENVYGASWGSNDVIVFATHEALWQVSSSGGEARVLAVPDTARGVRYRWPEILPDGETVLFTQVDETGFQLATLSMETGVLRLLGVEGTNPHFVADGGLVFARQDGALFAVAFDAHSLEIRGPTLPLAEGLSVGIHGAAKLGLSLDGALAYLPERASDRTLVAVDRSGGVDPLPIAPGRYHTARLSPDGARIVTEILSPGGSEGSLWVVETEPGTVRQLTHERGGRSPIWSPDGARIAYSTAAGGREAGLSIRWTRADGADASEVLVPAQGNAQGPVAFVRDGSALVYQRMHAETGLDIGILPLTAERVPRWYLRTPFNERATDLSPDGGWLAYASDESGRDEVYVRPFPGPGTAVRVSEGGGAEPRWAPSGRELFYRSAAGMIAAHVGTDPSVAVSRRDVLFADAPYVAIRGGVGYDVYADGERFLMIKRGPEGHEVIVVLNWFEQLRGAS